MASGKWKVGELPESEQTVLRQMYGPQIDGRRGYAPNQKIQYVRELSEQEISIFGQQVSFSPVCSLQQAQYKLRGNLTPIRFNRAIHEMICQEEALRLNFCSVGNRMLAVIFQERKDLPDVLYRNMKGLDGQELEENLQTYMERDFRQDFDMRHGHLLRFSVFHTGREEYAIIVTAAQPILELFDIRRVFHSALGSAPVSEYKPRKARLVEMETSVREYWSRILSDLPPLPRIPYAKGSFEEKTAPGRQENYVTYLPGYLASELQEHAKSNKMMLMTILQTAWGILLQRSNACKDVSFCLLVPSRDKKELQGMGAKSMVPVRLRLDDTMTIHETAAKAFQQFVVSQPYASLGKEGIREILSQRGEMFDHFLNFYDFFAEEGSYTKIQATEEGALVSQSSWDARDIRLGIGFRIEQHCIVMTCLYDTAQFSSDGIQLLVKDYFFVLQQMMADWTEDAATFTQRLEQHRDRMKELVEAEQGDSRKRVQDFLSRLYLFQECEEGIIQMLMQDAKLSRRFEGDLISGKEVEEQMVFVVQGKVCRSIETGDGWYNTLDILNENSWINETVLLPDHKTQLAAEVLTDQATILTIPMQSMQASLSKSPRIGKSIIQHTIRQLEKYQRVWVHS